MEKCLFKLSNEISRLKSECYKECAQNLQRQQKGINWGRSSVLIELITHSVQANRDLFVQSQQWKHKNKVRNLFKNSNTSTRTTSIDVGMVSLLTLNLFGIVFRH